MTMTKETRENLHILLDDVIDTIDSGHSTILFVLNNKIANINIRKQKRFSGAIGWDVEMKFNKEITGAELNTALDALEKSKRVEESL